MISKAEEPPIPKNYGKSYFFAFLASLFAACSNIISSQMSKKYAFRALFAEFSGFYVSWLFYHLFLFLRRIILKTESSSNYKKAVDENQSQEKISFELIFVPLRRGLIILSCISCLTLTYYYAAKSGINQGIITSIFSSSLIFTSIWFFIFHGQKLTKWDLVGVTMVIACILCISIAKSSSSSASSDTSIYKLYAVILALAEGVLFSIRTIDMNKTSKLKISVMQTNIDANLVLATILLPFYIYF